MYGDEDEDLMLLKREDSYHYSIPFEYIKRHLGNDDVEMGTAYMEVDVRWSDSELGYKISYSCSSMSDIDPNEGNSDIDEFFEYQVEDVVRENLSSEGVEMGAICV